MMIFFGAIFLFSSSKLQHYTSLDFSSTTLSITFLTVNENPYALGQVLSHYQTDTRQFFEEVVEIIASGSSEKANAQDMPSQIKPLLDAYISGGVLTGYKLEVIREQQSPLTGVNVVSLHCGAGQSGVCEKPQNIFGSACNVGYVVVDDNGMCYKDQVCCFYDGTKYHNDPKTKDVAIVHCGINAHEGTCGVKTSTTALTCSNDLGGNPDDCNTANNGKTPICCYTPAAASFPKNIAVAEIPIFYKNTPLSFLKVSAW
ncbi:MAG: hypothetical protein HY832_01415 [Candidatus Aenigmarchaeota archaeon]|nr:hypothetical protein [Candidatus Aenigmarchaeota archaeon]